MLETVLFAKIKEYVVARDEAKSLLAESERDPKNEKKFWAAHDALKHVNEMRQIDFFDALVDWTINKLESMVKTPRLWKCDRCGHIEDEIDGPILSSEVESWSCPKCSMVDLNSGKSLREAASHLMKRYKV